MNTRRPNPSSSRRSPAQGEASSRAWLPALAAAGVLGVVVLAGVSGKGRSEDNAVPAAALAPTTANADPNAITISNGSVDGTDGNPGAVDLDGLSVPSVTQAGVVVESTQAPIVKTAFAASIFKGSYNDDVKELQQRLTDLKFAPGPVDGAFGTGTQQAVWAYKKLVRGLRWQDLEASQNASEVDNDLWQQMQDPIVIQPRRPQLGGTHVEIYIPLQVMVVFTDNIPTLITHISSGSDETWCELLEYDTDEKGQPLTERRVSDECGVSHTPGGVFKFYRRYEGKRVGALGGMFNPVYFNYGIAVHGAKEVPKHPASHGCIRINMDIAVYLPSLVKNRELVYVWGQDGKEPEYYTRREMTPTFNYPNPDASSTTSSSSSTTTVVPATTAEGAPTTPSSATTPTATTTASATTSPPTATTAAPPVTAAPTTIATPPAITGAPTPTSPPIGP